MAGTQEAQLRTKAQQLIQDEDELVFDVCAEHGQMFGNVRHMAWLVDAVVEELRAS